jgi:hypothetical protein
VYESCRNAQARSNANEARLCALRSFANQDFDRRPCDNTDQTTSMANQRSLISCNEQMPYAEIEVYGNENSQRQRSVHY